MTEPEAYVRGSPPQGGPLLPTAAAVQEPALEAEGEWRLLRMVYAEPRMLWVNLAVVILIGGLCMSRAPATWLVLWTAGGVLIALFRLVELYDFRRRRWQPRQLRMARRRYIASAWLLAAHWGCADLSLLLTGDNLIHLWLVTTQAAVLASAVARSSPVIPAAQGYVVLTLLPLLAVCLSSGSIHMAVFGIIILMFIVASLLQARSLHDQTVRLLATDEANAALIQSVQIINERLAAANAQLSAIARLDSLTGLANRRAFDEILHDEYRRCIRAAVPFSLLLIDIDHFKAFNDTYGHPAGDVCLRQVADCIQDGVRRPGDTAARYGGEEFAAILPCTDVLGATETAERIRLTVERLAVPIEAGRDAVVTISIGVATIPCPSHEGEIDALLSAADARLYDAKHRGRNCIGGGVSGLVPQPG